MAYMLCVCVLWCIRFRQSELAIYVLVLVNTEVGCLELFLEFKGIGEEFYSRQIRISLGMF
jgi:hypothetical protein